MSDSNLAILADQAGSPVCATPNTTLSSPQSSALTSGSDYGTPPKAQTPKIDALGNQYAVPMVGAVPVPVQVNQATTTPQSLYGSVSLAWDDANKRFVPFQVDPTGAGVVRNALASTCVFAPTTQISTGGTAGKSMLSVFNNTSSLYFRCSALFLMCPPQAAVSGGLLQTSTTYTTIGMQIARFTTLHAGGTVIAPAYHDMRTPTDAGITARTGATIANQQGSALRVMDAAYSSTYPYLTRSDAGMQLPTFGPGEGMNLAVLSALGGNGISFYVTAIIAQNTA
ncbi:MAG: hypothetical protein EOO38_01815 [Cytophagaceae bacterium]|nr:MAG: hypothetical protein EOO38_01815 [Cytophagaceae bacterium]